MRDQCLSIPTQRAPAEAVNTRWWECPPPLVESSLTPVLPSIANGFEVSVGGHHTPLWKKIPRSPESSMHPPETRYLQGGNTLFHTRRRCQSLRERSAVEDAKDTVRACDCSTVEVISQCKENQRGAICSFDDTFAVHRSTAPLGKYPGNPASHSQLRTLLRCSSRMQGR